MKSRKSSLCHKRRWWTAAIWPGGIPSHDTFGDDPVPKIDAHYATNAVGVVDSSRTYGPSPCNRTGNVPILAMPYGRRDFGTAACRWQSPVVAAANCRCLGRRFRNPSLRGERSDLTIPARASRVPNLIRHCEEHSDVAISMRLNTRRRTAVATATRLPRYARNDTVGALAMTKCVRMSGPDTTTVAAIPSGLWPAPGRRLWEGLQRQRGCTTNQKRAGC